MLSVPEYIERLVVALARGHGVDPETYLVQLVLSDVEEHLSRHLTTGVSTDCVASVSTPDATNGSLLT